MTRDDKTKLTIMLRIAFSLQIPGDEKKSLIEKIKRLL